MRNSPTRSFASKAKIAGPAILLFLTLQGTAQTSDTLKTFEYNGRTYEMYDGLNQFSFEISGMDKLDNTVMERLESLRTHLNGLSKLGGSGPQFLAKKSLISLNFAKNPTIVIIVPDEQGKEKEKIVFEDGTAETHQKLQELLVKHAELTEKMKTGKKSKQEKTAQELVVLEDEIDELKKAQQTAVDKVIAYFSKSNARGIDMIESDTIQFVRAEVGKLDVEDDTMDTSAKQSIYEPMPRFKKVEIILAH